MRRAALRFCLILAASLASIACPAHEGEEIEEIVVRGRWDKPTGLLTSASQGLIGQAELDVRPRLRTGDILEAVPGLIVTQHSGSGKSNQMFLRGFNLDHGTDFATWIDGMPVNIPTHGHGQGYTDLNFIIPELVEVLEFKKGPYYADVSDFSSAGAAYLTLARKLDEGMVKAGLGEDSFAQLLVADSFTAGDGDLLIGVQAHGYDGPWDGIAEDLSRYSGVVRYSDASESTERNLTLMAYDATWNSADQVPLRAVEAGLVSPLGTVDQTLGGASSRYSLSGRWHRDFGHQQLTVRGYAIDYDLQLFSNFTYFLDDPVGGDQIEQVDRRRVYGGDAAWRFQFHDGSAYTAGLMIRFDDIDAVGLFRNVARTRVETVRLDEVAQLSAGVYQEYEKVWNDVWRSTVGLRADFYRFDVTESNIPANTGTENDWLVSPKLSVIRTLSENAEAFVSAGLGFHSNDARGTVISVDPVTGEDATPVDPLVQSAGAEIGYRLFVNNRLNLSASLWYLELDSELLFVGDAGNTEVSRPSRRYGLELPVYYRIDDTWMFDAELALTDSQFTGSDPAGNRVPGSLDKVFAAGITGTFSNGVYGSLRLRHFGERPLIEDGGIASGSSSVWNLGLGYRTRRFDLRLEVLNLFDSNDDDISYFYTSRLPGEPAGGVDDVHFHPMEPRTIRAYVTWLNGN